MDPKTLAFLAAGIGAGITVIGAGLGIGKLASAAMEATGRQPEAGGTVRITMIIAAALIEGVAFFSLIICLFLSQK
jgi:F-type H+-transporting ATPase subunit c